MMRKLLVPSGAILAVVAALLFGAAPAMAANPRVIRVGYPGVGIGNRPYVGGSAFSVLHALGWLQDEFAKDGIKVEFTFFKGAGPALNEAAANGLLDIWYEGDLPAVVARAGGLKTRFLLGDGIRGQTYVAVPADSPVTRIEELRGKRVAIFKGTNWQLSAARFLAAHGLSERDLRAINMDSATAKAALTTKDVDAVVGGTDLIDLRNRGIAKIVYATKGESLAFTRQCSVLATQEFIDRHPEIVQRVVNVWVRAAHWRSREKNRNELYQVWSKSGVPYATYKEEYEGLDLHQQASPLIDEFLLSRYRAAIEDSRRLGFIRKDFDVDQWIDGRFLRKALEAAGLQGHWAELDASGKPKPATTEKS